MGYFAGSLPRPFSTQHREAETIESIACYRPGSSQLVVVTPFLDFDTKTRSFGIRVSGISPEPALDEQEKFG